VSLAGFAVAAETANVAGRAAGPGSQAGRPGLGSVWLAQGHSMYGTEGAITLFVLRQGVSLARMAVRFGVMGGQIELSRTRPPPPRRVEVKIDATA